MFGDERARVPVGGLRLRPLPYLDQRDDEPFAEFLGIEPDEFRARRERWEHESFVSFERANRNYQVPTLPVVDAAGGAAMYERLHQLVEASAVAAGFAARSPHTWRRAHNRMTFSLKLHPSRRPTADATSYDVGVALEVRRASTAVRQHFSATDCQDSGAQGRLNVRDGAPVFECGQWQVDGAMAERAFTRSVANLLDLFAWIVAEKDRWDYLQHDSADGTTSWQRSATSRQNVGNATRPCAWPDGILPALGGPLTAHDSISTE
jgi:hypothetical protein